MKEMTITINVTIDGVPPNGTTSQTMILPPWVLTRPVSNWGTYVDTMLGLLPSEIYALLNAGLDNFSYLSDGDIPRTQKVNNAKPKVKPKVKLPKRLATKHIEQKD